MYYFRVENLSNLCKLIVCGSQIIKSTQKTQRFPKHRPIKSYIQLRIQQIIIQYTQHTVNLYIQHAWCQTHHTVITAKHSPTARPVELHKVKPTQF